MSTFNYDDPQYNILIEKARDAVLGALDAAALDVYGKPLFGWKDAELPALFKAIDAQARLIAERAQNGED